MVSGREEKQSEKGKGEEADPLPQPGSVQAEGERNFTFG